MPRESLPAKAARAHRVFALLRRTYPEARCELGHRTPLDLLIATMLSAQCSDRQVNLVTTRLFERYRTAADYAQADPETLAQAIRRLGLFRIKARNIQACCRRLLAHHRGQVPNTMEALLQLQGVGRKTANVVLGNAFGVHAGIVVDTHVARLSRRLGFTRERDPAKIEQSLMRLVPADQWTMASHWLIWHGRRRCSARTPDCAHCEIGADCPRVGVGARTLRERPSPRPRAVRAAPGGARRTAR
ncbi:MAG: endonuclease III [Verrucomicrobia bacterium]|nr:endonuclease III [Verrucomicrobiota bacterium]